jgi:hypothetical protein
MIQARADYREGVIIVSTYRRVIVWSGVGMGALALGVLLIKLLPDDQQPVVLISLLFAMALISIGYAYTIRCPNCGTGIVWTARSRIRSGKLSNCAKCGIDLKRN